MLLLDAVGLGLLRRELIDTLALTGARAALTHFGYAHGWRTAERLRLGFPWDSEEEWRVSGPSGAAAKLRIPPSSLSRGIKALKIPKKKFRFLCTP